MIAIVDYGMGNLDSVAKAVRRLKGRAAVTADPAVIARASGVIFPGVGAFGAAMRELRRRKLVKPLVDSIEINKPFLGLCLGLQLLFTSSEESPGVKGLGVLPGRVRKFRNKPGLKIPHMGWNQVEKIVRHASCVLSNKPKTQDPRRRTNPLLKGVPEGAFMYFVHSFFADPKENKVVAAWTRHGGLFPSIVWNGNRLWATQFHPEKSQKWGLQILKNYVELTQCS